MKLDSFRKTNNLNHFRKCNIRTFLPEKLLGPLATVGWLSAQPAAFKQWAIEVGRVRQFSSGEYIYRAGDQPDGIYGLRSGTVEMEFPLLANDPVSLQRAAEGFWIGDAALLTKIPRIISVVAAQDSTFFYLPGRAVKQLLAEEPAYWEVFYDLSSRNVAAAVQFLAEALSLTVKARACRLLLKLSENSKEVHLSQDEISKTLGVSRLTVRRCLADLTDLGAVETKYRRICIADRCVLQRFTDEQ